MVRKIDILNFKSLWQKIVAGIVISTILFCIGTFYPNPYTKYKLRLQSENFYTNWANNLGLQEPAFNYNNDIQFVNAVRKCVDWVNFETPRYERVPVEMIVGMAALESGWGTSRFAVEGNNLFGIRTFDQKVPHMLIEGRTKWKGWGVRIFPTKCQGVKFFVELLNNHNAYEEFRDVRRRMILWDQQLDSIKLVRTLKNYSTTDDYAERVIYIIEKIRKQEQQSGEIPIETKTDAHVVPPDKPKDLNK
jgi:uncharacterized FlgJ-related protein